jgi:ribonuclease-3
LTHSSRANEEGRPGHDNERLEFLGDSILSFLTAHLLWKSFPDLKVGEISRFRSRLVSEENLARSARHLGLGRVLRLGKSERTGKGAKKPSLLADAFEAVLAAVFLDGGLKPVRLFLEQEMIPMLAEYRRDPLQSLDAKTRLQELLQDRGQSLPTYRLVSTLGPPHDRRFKVSLSLGGEVLGRGSGRSKKTAEQQAAIRALRRLEAGTEATADPNPTRPRVGRKKPGRGNP